MQVGRRWESILNWHQRKPLQFSLQIRKTWRDWWRKVQKICGRKQVRHCDSFGRYFISPWWEKPPTSSRCQRKKHNFRDQHCKWQSLQAFHPLLDCFLRRELLLKNKDSSRRGPTSANHIRCNKGVWWATRLLLQSKVWPWLPRTSLPCSYKQWEVWLQWFCMLLHRDLLWGPRKGRI